METAQHRSIPLTQLLPLLHVEGVTWVNLQYNHDPTELDQLAKEHGVQIHHFEGVTADLLATAALTAQLDLVITVQQTAAHIAGAIGTPAWVLLPFALLSGGMACKAPKCPGTTQLSCFVKAALAIGVFRSKQYKAVWELG